MKPLNPKAPLIEGISQYEVDFVIPRVGIDLPLGIDPFLLFKSRDPVLSGLHEKLLAAFNQGLEYLRAGNTSQAQLLFEYPEVDEIGFGYTKKGRKGSGVGKFLSSLITETLLDSEALLERGIKHVEEMQLVSLGISHDRVSDIAGNILKEFLIQYTQKQSALWNIPIENGVPVEHIFDFESYDWYDGYFDLPISPIDGRPILLVPRRIVRTFPWINYNDFLRLEFSTFPRAKRVRGKLAGKETSAPAIDEAGKRNIVAITRAEVERIDRYVSAKEAAAASAQPSLTYLDKSATCPEGEVLKDRLTGMSPGQAGAADYQRLVLEILNYLFNPELIDGELEVRTVEGTERRDIIFTNDSDQSFWAYLRMEHSGIVLMFETKNTQSVTIDHINQTATYLGDGIGRIGFIVSRAPIGENEEKKIFTVFNKSTPRKIILGISDSDIAAMLDMKCAGTDPMRYVQKLYRTFRTRVQ